MGKEDKIKKNIAEVMKTKVDEEIDYELNQVLDKVGNALIKQQIKIELKNMIRLLLKCFVLLTFAYFSLKHLYSITQNHFLIENASFHIIKSLKGKEIFVNYIFYSIAMMFSYILIIFTEYKSKVKNYEEKRSSIIYIRNGAYVFFILIFILTSFSVEHLDLITLIISLIVLFEVIFKKDNTLSENEIRDLIKQEKIKIMKKELDK